MTEGFKDKEWIEVLAASPPDARLGALLDQGRLAVGNAVIALGFLVAGQAGDALSPRFR